MISLLLRYLKTVAETEKNCLYFSGKHMVRLIFKDFQHVAFIMLFALVVKFYYSRIMFCRRNMYTYLLMVVSTFNKRYLTCIF